MDELHQDAHRDQIPGSIQRPKGRSLPKGRTGRKDKRDRTRPSGDVTVEITERDIAILRLVDKHRLVNADQLWAVLGGGRNERSFCRRLEHLFHAKGGSVLDRPPAQFRPGYPARPYVYAVGPAGRRELDRLDGINRVGRRDVRNENDRLKLHFIEHEIAVAEVALAFQMATERQGWTFELALEHEIPAITGLPHSIEITFVSETTEPLPLRPDFHFAIDADGSRSTYLVEVDLGTEPQIRWNFRTSSIVRKAAAYWQLSRWNPSPVDGVLFVTTSKKRLDNMIEVVRRVDPKAKGSHFFQFGVLDDFRISNHAALYYEPILYSAKIGYPNARPVFLDECPRCHQSVDRGNEPHEILNSDPRILLAPATTALHEFIPDVPLYTHTACNGIR